MQGFQSTAKRSKKRTEDLFAASSHGKYTRRENTFLKKQLEEGIDDYYDELEDEEKIEYDDSSFFRIRSIESEEEADVIQAQYEKAMSRGSDYLGNVWGWCMDPTTQVIESENGDYVVGFRCGRSFILSHFAPCTLRTGSEFISWLSEWNQSVVAAVLPKQASMMERLGFERKGEIPQWFDGRTVTKTVMVNQATTDEDLQDILAHGTSKWYVVIFLASPEIASEEDVVNCLMEDENAQAQFLKVLKNKMKYHFIQDNRIIKTMKILAARAKGSEFFKKCVDLMNEAFKYNSAWKNTH